jgi:hypothetical protein
MGQVLAREAPVYADRQDPGFGTLPVRMHDLTYDPVDGLCEPLPPSEIDGHWMVTGSRPEPVGTPMELTLWDRDSRHAGSDHMATVTVIPPSASTNSMKPFMSVKAPNDFLDR